MGLVNKVVPAAQVMDEARALAKDFAAKSPLVMELARDAFMRANDFEYRRAIEKRSRRSATSSRPTTPRKVWPPSTKSGRRAGKPGERPSRW